MNLRALATAEQHRATAARIPDVRIENHGSVVLLRLNTAAARDWERDNIGEDAPHFGPALVVEPRYVADIVAGMTADGLEVA